jgi:hypothetical protein
MAIVKCSLKSVKGCRYSGTLCIPLGERIQSYASMTGPGQLHEQLEQARAPQSGHHDISSTSLISAQLKQGLSSMDACGRGASVGCKAMISGIMFPQGAVVDRWLMSGGA